MISVPVIVSDRMMRTAWMVYDANGAVINCGVIGAGSLNTPGMENAIVAKIVCGQDAFDALSASAKQQQQR